MNKGSTSKKRLILIVGIVIALLGIVIATLPHIKSTPEENAKKVISKAIGRDNFKVSDILIEENGWELVKITDESGDNAAFAILHKENNKLVIRFGPGTNFDRKTLSDSSVPESIINKVVGDYPSDPILKHLPNITNFYKVTYGGKNVDNIQKRGTDATVLYVYIFEVPRLGIYATEDSFDKYKTEINQWLTSLSLNPNDYVLVLANGDTGVSGD